MSRFPTPLVAVPVRVVERVNGRWWHSCFPNERAIDYFREVHSWEYGLPTAVTQSVHGRFAAETAGTQGCHVTTVLWCEVRFRARIVLGRTDRRLLPPSSTRKLRCPAIHAATPAGRCPGVVRSLWPCLPYWHKVCGCPACRRNRAMKRRPDWTKSPSPPPVVPRASRMSH